MSDPKSKVQSFRFKVGNCTIRIIAANSSDHWLLPATWNIEPGTLNFSFRDQHFRPAQHEFWLLAGIPVFALLGDQQRTHALDPLAADAFVQGGIVSGADDGVVGLDAVAAQAVLDLARLDGNSIGPGGDGDRVIG